MSAYSILANSLQAQDVKQIYGVIGIPIIELGVQLHTSGITFYAFRNEQQSSYAAGVEGYLTQRPGVCLTVSGPGYTNALSGLANAKENSWPMILISGSSELNNTGMGSFQEFPQAESAITFCKWSVRINTLEMIPRVIERAFRISMRGRPGPVYIDLPSDLLKTSLKEIPPILPLVNNILPYPDPVTVNKALELLKSAKRPLVIVGKGAAYSKAENEIREFIRKTGIPFLPTPMGKGVVRDDDPNNVSAARTTAIGQADVILLLGAKLNWILHFGIPPRFDGNVQFISVNVDFEEISNNCRAKVEVYSDVRLFMQLALVNLGSWKFNQTEWVKVLSAGISKNAKLTESQLLAPEFNYYRALSTIQKYLTEDTILISEGANTMDVTRTVVYSNLPRSRIDAGTWGTMGVSMAACISAKILNPKRPVVAIVGDSSFGFSGMELETATRYNLPFTVFIINNNGVFSGHSSLSPNPKENLPMALNPSSKYELLGEAFGGKGFEVKDVNELEKVIKSLDNSTLNVVNVRINTDSGKKPQTHFWLAGPTPKL